MDSNRQVTKKNRSDNTSRRKRDTRPIVAHHGHSQTAEFLNSETLRYSLKIAELGQAFVYDPALAHAAAVEEARQTRTVPVVVAEK